MIEEAKEYFLLAAGDKRSIALLHVEHRTQHRKDLGRFPPKSFTVSYWVSELSGESSDNPSFYLCHESSLRAMSVAVA